MTSLTGNHVGTRAPIVQGLVECYVDHSLNQTTTFYRAMNCTGIPTRFVPVFREISRETQGPPILRPHSTPSTRLFKLTPSGSVESGIGEGSHVSCRGLCGTCPPLTSVVFTETNTWGGLRSCWYVSDFEAGDLNIDMLEMLVREGKVTLTDAVNNMFAPFCMSAPIEDDRCGVDIAGNNISKCPRVIWHGDCKRMFVSLPASTQDVLVRRYCNMYPDAAACDCQNALSSSCTCTEEDQGNERCEVRCIARGARVREGGAGKGKVLVSDMSMFANSPLACWFSPCQPQTTYTLLTTETKIQQSMCPDVCGSAMSIEGSEVSAKISDVFIYANCAGMEGIKNTREDDIVLPTSEKMKDPDFDLRILNGWVKSQQWWLTPCTLAMFLAAATLTFSIIASRKKRLKRMSKSRKVTIP